MPLLRFTGDQAPVTEPVDAGSDVDLEQLIASPDARGPPGSRSSLSARATLLGVMVLSMAAVAVGLRMQRVDHNVISLWFEQKWGFHQGHGHGALGVPIDKDGDGKFDSEELAQLSKKAETWLDITDEKFQEELAAADVDGDSKLDKEEVQSFLHESAGPNKKAPTDMHPWLSAKKEWMQHHHVMKELEELDENGNGQLAKEELNVLAEKLKEQFGLSAETVTAAVGKADSNGDGKLQKEEIPALLKAMRREVGSGKKFDRLDQDGNGMLDGVEVQELSKRLQEHLGISDSKFQELFQGADGDGDGKLSRSEARALVGEVHLEAVVHSS